MNELIDIFDEGMNHLGTMEKWQARKKDVWIRGVHVWITDGRNVLVQLRSENKKNFPNLWDISVGGHVSAGETPLQAAKREFKEELGLPWTFGDLKEDIIFKTYVLAPGDIAKEFSFVYFLKTKIDIEKLKLQREEVADIKYVPHQEFIKLFNSKDFVPHAKDYIETVLVGISKHLN
ncbi:MAG: NUDIX domain-containing protein [Firmicutes bacterium]|nr:NUDIX domain-containing protein [Bacillota bacterium]